jgi:thiamine-monophosphate kinase
VEAAAAQAQVVVTRIGHIDAQPGLRLLDAQGHAVARSFPGFDHFRA